MLETRNFPCCVCVICVTEGHMNDAGSVAKDQEQINEWWKVIVSEKRTTQEVFLYLSPSNKKIARRLKREGGAALSEKQLVFIRFCGIYML